MEDIDHALALAMQAEYDLEASFSYEDEDKTEVVVSPTHASENQPKSIVDPAWELLDPNPDIRTLFLEFNARYFWSMLNMVEVKWSPRMTLCAGLCCYEGRGGLCSIRLSKPLLQLRPRKDLVETLLHEMIHALLFVTDNNKDHDGHGPEFCKHMHRLNKETGTNITIYHNFNDEVDSLRQHWWRCEGPCRTKPPYFGFVRRAMNRAPSPRDTWWAKHQSTCGGTYIKVKEPENYKAKNSKKKGVPSKVAKHIDPDITPFLQDTSKTELGTSSSSQKKIDIPWPSQPEGYRLGGRSVDESHSGRGIPSVSRLLSGHSTTKIKEMPGKNTVSQSGGQNLDHWLKTGSMSQRSITSSPKHRSDNDSGDDKISKANVPMPPKVRKIPNPSQNLSLTESGSYVKSGIVCNDTPPKHPEIITIEDTSPPASDGMTSCPICHNSVTLANVNSHVDECLSVKAIMDSSFE